MELNKIIGRKDGSKVKVEYPSDKNREEIIADLENKGFVVEEIEYSRLHWLIDIFTDDDHSGISMITFYCMGALIASGNISLGIGLFGTLLVWEIYLEGKIREKFNLEL